MIGHRNCVVVVVLLMMLLILDRWNNGRRGLEKMMMMIGVVGGGGGELMLDSSMIHRCGRGTGTAVATGKMKRLGFTSIQFPRNFVILTTDERLSLVIFPSKKLSSEVQSLIRKKIKKKKMSIHATRESCENTKQNNLKKCKKKRTEKLTGAVIGDGDGAHGDMGKDSIDDEDDDDDEVL